MACNLLPIGAAPYLVVFTTFGNFAPSAEIPASPDPKARPRSLLALSCHDKPTFSRRRSVKDAILNRVYLFMNFA